MNPLTKKLLIAVAAGVVSASAIVMTSEERKRRARTQSRTAKSKASKKSAAQKRQKNLVTEDEADVELNAQSKRSQKGGYRTLTEDAAYLASKKLKDKLQNAVIDQAGLRDVVDAMSEGRERLSSVAEAVRDEVKGRVEAVSSRVEKGRGKISDTREDVVGTVRKVAEVVKAEGPGAASEAKAKASDLVKKAADKAAEKASNYIPGDPDEVREWGSNMERAMDKLNRWATGPGTPIERTPKDKKLKDDASTDVILKESDDDSRVDSESDVVDAKF